MNLKCKENVDIIIKTTKLPLRLVQILEVNGKSLICLLFHFPTSIENVH